MREKEDKSGEEDRVALLGQRLYLESTDYSRIGQKCMCVEVRPRLAMISSCFSRNF